MKKSPVLLTLSVLSALCFVAPAQAQSTETFSELQIHYAQAQAAASQAAAIRAAVITLAHGQNIVWVQPPLTLPAGVNWEVGRSNSVGARNAEVCQPSHAYEVELWQIVPKVLRFSRSGRLISRSR